MDQIPDLYSRDLFQLIDYGYIGGIQTLYDFNRVFENSKYHPLMFKPQYKWHFSKPEPYKHYFMLFSSQVATLPDSLGDRINALKTSFQSAIEINQKMTSVGIFMDDNSDGSHLPFWLTSIFMFEKYLKEQGYEI